jgi:glutaredoxin
MQEKKLELYYFEQCPYCQIVLSAIKTNGLNDKVHYFDTRKESKHREKLISDTGRSTVPCLYIDGKPMHESRDIADWLKKYADELKKA